MIYNNIQNIIIKLQQALFNSSNPTEAVKRMLLTYTELKVKSPNRQKKRIISSLKIKIKNQSQLGGQMQSLVQFCLLAPM